MDHNDIKNIATKAWALRQERLAKQKELDAMEQQEKEYMAEIEQYMAGTYDKLLLDGIEANCKETIEPEVTHWDLFQEHIRRTGQLDLLQKRPMISAIKARWESGDDVPGIERIHGFRTTLKASRV